LKVLVVYDTRHGFTEHCLGLLSAELPQAELWPLRARSGTPAWSDYDAVVFGGPVYFGRWAPRVVRLLARHTQAVAAIPTVAAFVVSLSPRAGAQQYLRRALPDPLAGKPGHVACFGGSIVWNKLAWWEKVLVRRARGIETDVSNLDLGEIQGLAAWLSARASAKPAAP
jgi:menaquinone-dependent protoporphyrinogen IX oxidase